MSKTDKTKPFRAQVPDSPRARHDHTDGVCDLPTLEEWAKMSKRDRWGRGFHSCTWEPSNWHTYKGFSRSQGDKNYLADKRNHKYPDWKNK